MISSFLPSLLHSHHALLLRHRWRMNTFSKFKIHRHIYGRCLQSMKLLTFCLPLSSKFSELCEISGLLLLFDSYFASQE